MLFCAAFLLAIPVTEPLLKSAAMVFFVGDDRNGVPTLDKVCPTTMVVVPPAVQGTTGLKFDFESVVDAEPSSAAPLTDWSTSRVPAPVVTPVTDWCEPGTVFSNC